uniref:Uncharacterized protein n=1 Tax=Octopus bimaculoides TaxID=37653 RepID=A0A0L8IH64_OCTBM
MCLPSKEEMVIQLLKLVYNSYQNRTSRIPSNSAPFIYFKFFRKKKKILRYVIKL